jgi:hypothetical protein
VVVGVIVWVACDLLAWDVSWTQITIQP